MTKCRMGRHPMSRPRQKECGIVSCVSKSAANFSTVSGSLSIAPLKTGLTQPVRDLTALAEARGAEVIVDAAHSFGQLPLALPELGAAFVGINLHKSERLAEAAAALHDELQASGLEVLFDDRDARPGVKFADAELLGEQALANGVTIVYSFVVTIAIMLALKATIGVRVDPEVEAARWIKDNCKKPVAAPERPPARRVR